MLDPNTFICSGCGECCIKYIVKLSKADIKRIKSLGLKEHDFVDIDQHIPGPNKTVLKKKNNQWCIFLNKNPKGDFVCNIYDERPNVCRKYPFLKKNVETCKPITFSSKY